MTERYVIYGRPMTKKNSMRIYGKRVLQSKAYVKYEREALMQLLAQVKKRYGERAVSLSAHYYMPNRRSWPDLVGLLQATSDILEKAGVYQNDGQIVSYDGSRIVGVDKENPRVEVTVASVGKED